MGSSQSDMEDGNWTIGNGPGKIDSKKGKIDYEK